VWLSDFQHGLRVSVVSRLLVLGFRLLVLGFWF
jgi:hypothetical protein